MAYDTTHVFVVYNVITAAQLQQFYDNDDYLLALALRPRYIAETYYPIPEVSIDGGQVALTANRIYVAKIWIPWALKITGIFGRTNAGSPNTHWGMGVYDTSGNRLCYGTTGSIGGDVACNVTFASYALAAGQYLLCHTGDAAGLLYCTVPTRWITFMNQETANTMFGYTATTSASGVLPATINPSLTNMTATPIWAFGFQITA